MKSGDSVPCLVGALEWSLVSRTQMEPVVAAVIVSARTEYITILHSIPQNPLEKSLGISPHNPCTFYSSSSSSSILSSQIVEILLQLQNEEI